MELVVQMVTKHQWFIGLTLGFELLWWFPVERKEKTYEKNMEYPSPWDHTYFIVLTFWHLVVPCSAFTAWCKIGRVSVLFVLIQFQFSHCFFLRSLSVCAGKCQTQSQCPRWWIAMLCELHRRAPLCAVFHVISQETDLVGHYRLWKLNFSPLQLTLTRGIAKVSLTTATINAGVFMYTKRIRTYKWNSYLGKTGKFKTMVPLPT